MGLLMIVLTKSCIVLVVVLTVAVVVDAGGSVTVQVFSGTIGVVSSVK